MKLFKSFRTNDDKEIDKFLNEHKDELAGSILNISPENVVIVIDNDKLRGDRIVALENQKTNFYRIIDEQAVEVKNNKEFLFKKNRFFAELDLAKRNAKDKKERENLDKKIVESGEEAKKIQNDIIIAESIILINQGRIKAVDERINEIKSEK